MAYKAFISYSHAADGRLAPALQSALHRFAKPWYRMRALRVFRDKTSLSASPALWPTIQQALAESEYFLLLASPEAARSPWVGREVDWWMANRPADRMLVVLTDGELAWDGAAGDFDWSRTTALPASLRGKLREEPLYADLRWAKKEENLSLRHSQFRGAILDIATPLHGRPKDELDGDDVRQHRKTRAIAAAAVLALLVFAVGAAWAAVIATQQRRIAEKETRRAQENEKEANRQKERAEEQTKEAKKQRQEADRQRKEAERQAGIAEEKRQEAVTQARIAEERRQNALGKQLAAQANSIRESRPRDLTLGVLLALEGSKHLRSEETDLALRAGLRLLPPVPRVFRHDDGVTGVALAPGGRLLTWTRKAAFLRNLESGRPHGALACEEAWGVSSAVVSAEGRIAALRCNNGTGRVWNLETGRSATVASEVVGGMALAPDGSWLGTIGRGGAVSIWSLPEGALLVRFDPPQGEEHLSGAETAVLAASPDGKFLAKGFRGSSPVQVFPVPGRGGSPPPWNPGLSDRFGHVIAIAFDPSGRYLAAAGAAMGHVQWWGPDRSGGGLQLGGLIKDLAFSHDGEFLAVGIEDNAATPILKVDGGRVVARMQHRGGVKTLAFSPDDRWLATAGSDGTARLWNVGDGSELARMTHGDSVAALAFGEDGRSLATASDDGTARLWTIPEGPADGRAWPAVDESLSDDPFHFHTPDWRIVAEARGETAVIRALPGGAVVQTLRHEPPLDWEAIERRDVERGGSIRGVKQQIDQWKERGSVEVKFLSPDGTALLTTRADERLYLWNLRTGRERARFDGRDLSVLALSRSGDFLAAAREGTARVWSADGRQLAQVRHRCERSDLICRIDGLGLSHDGSYLVTVAQRIARLHEIRGAREIEGGAVLPAWEPGVSPEGRYLLTQGRGGSVRIRNLLRGGAREIGLRGGAAITNISFSPGESLLLLADQDGRAKIVELPGGREIAGLFPGPFSSAAFSRDGKLIAFDEAVWNLAERTKIAQLSGTGGIAGFSPDTRYLLTPRRASRHEWLWRTEDLAETACARLERNLTPTEWERYIGDPARGGEPYRKTCPDLP